MSSISNSRQAITSAASKVAPPQGTTKYEGGTYKRLFKTFSAEQVSTLSDNKTPQRTLETAIETNPEAKKSFAKLTKVDTKISRLEIESQNFISRLNEAILAIQSNFDQYIEAGKRYPSLLQSHALYSQTLESLNAKVKGVQNERADLEEKIKSLIQEKRKIFSQIGGDLVNAKPEVKRQLSQLEDQEKKLYADFERINKIEDTLQRDLNHLYTQTSKTLLAAKLPGALTPQQTQQLK